MAKKFSFRLDPVLKLRSHKVNQAKVELGHIVGLRTAKEKEIEEQEEYFDKLLTSEIKSTSASELQAMTSHKAFVEDEIKKLHNENEQLKELEDFRRNKLSNAMKDEKVLEKLKDKKQTIHKEELQKEETQTLDEIARNKHTKKEKL